MVISLFLISIVSSAEWDNVKSYDKETNTVIIKNSILFIPTTTILEATLNTPKMFYVGTGYQKVAEFIINPKEDYADLLKNFEYYNFFDNKQIQKQVDIKYLTYQDVEVPEYKNVLSANGTSLNEVKSGSHMEKKEFWIDFDNSIKINTPLTIGLFTVVESGETIEWIPEIAGVKVSEWAVWTSSLNVNLMAYYNFNQSVGTVIPDVINQKNLTGINAPVWITGKIPNGLNFSYNQFGFGSLANYFDWTGTKNMSISLWVYPVSVVGDQVLTIENKNWAFILSGTELYFYSTRLSGSWQNNMHTTTTGITTNTWQHIVLTNNGTDINGTVIYVNGVSQPLTKVYNGITTNTGDGSFRIGGDNSSTDFPSRYLNGTLDELGIWNRTLSQAEATQLYNAGSGITWGTLNAPNIDLISPIDNYNSSTATIIFNITVTDDKKVDNVTLFIDNKLNQTNTSKISGTYLFTKTLSEGLHNWSIMAWDNESQVTNSSLRNITIDTIIPLINISSPLDSINYAYLVYGNNLTLNITATDNHLANCWYNYNFTNTTLSCTNATIVSSNLTLTNQNNVTGYTNDSAGNVNSALVSWTYNLFDFNNYTYNINATESAMTTIIGYFQTGSAISSASLQYNNTNYTTSISSLGGNQYIISSTPTAPTVSSNVNISWFFWVNNINATPHNQTVLNINVDNCSAYAFTLVNYSLLDEGTQALINNANSTIESTIRLTSNIGEIVTEFNKVFIGNSTPRVCSAINLSSSGLRLWEQSRYGSTNYVYEAHNIQNRSITTTPIDILLFDLPSTDATTFRITYKSITFLPVPDAVIEIYRKYLGEGIYKEIESPITDDNGEASASFDLNAVTYKIIISINGTTLSTFINPAVACANILTGECNIHLNERQSVTLIETLDIVNDFSYGLTQNNRTISLSYTIPSGDTKLVNLLVNQTTILGNKTTCNQTSFATSGQIDCVVADSLGDVFTSIYVYSDGKLLVTGSSQILEDRSIYFGTDNIILTFFLVLSLILLTVSSPIAVLFSIVIGLIASSLMLFLNSGSLFGTASVLIYVVIIVIILVIKISSRDK